MLNPFYLIVAPSTFRLCLMVAIIVLGSLSVLSLVIMVIHKIRLESRHQVCLRLQERYEEVIRRFLRGGGSFPVAATALEKECLADAVVAMLPELPAADAERVREELREEEVVEHLLHRVEHARSWLPRFRALERLGFLRCVELRPVFRRIAEQEGDESPLGSKALWALSFVARENDLDFIIRQLADRPFISSKFNEYVFINVIGAYRERFGDDGAAEEITNLLLAPDIPPLLQRDLLEGAGKAGLKECAPVALELFRGSPQRPELRITALRVAGELEADGIEEILLPSLGDDDWRLRVIAAHYAPLCREAAVARLEELVRDESYHVRSNAARALADLGSAGEAALVRIRSGEDRYARDMSRYVMTEAGRG